MLLFCCCVRFIITKRSLSLITHHYRNELFLRIFYQLQLR
ncbi:hypothetical protein PROVRETT_06129 [Providencia rettgeri DSM 1131]|nr:hypothetical protein PROVRETT_06129 [Providencia rettgeri DSM 1131]